MGGAIYLDLLSVMELGGRSWDHVTCGYVFPVMLFSATRML